MAKRKRRTFTPEFKAKVVLEALRGESSAISAVSRGCIANSRLLWFGFCYPTPF